MKSLFFIPRTLFAVLSVSQVVHGLSASQLGNGRYEPAVGKSTTELEKTLPPVVSTVDFGQDKFVNLFLPANSRQFAEKAEKGVKITTQDGRGDVVWPAGFSLSRLIAHCPSLVDGKNVLELGCGLGAASAAACKYARPNHVALSDRDKSSLALAYASCVQLQRSRSSVSRCCMDWSDPTTWPAQDYNVLLAADVLYEKASINPLVCVLQHYLCNNDDDNAKRAVIVDPIHQVNRDAFCFAAYKAGLEVEQEIFPGSPDLMLLSVYQFA
ncbi:lysine methyltransferase [Nitzschia inconspicua]|uniref:Lysine methyltransferase n=1 Tax=Nitzschia inconspicua TaxID=303405 RepID=A0A9K3PZ57_9STRA|nr:lysine methyltransferase [Nitzschia inconspicua]